jgi:hypothetical protein
MHTKTRNLTVSIYTLLLALLTLLTACGGGTTDSTALTTSQQAKVTVTAASTTLYAGQTTALWAKALITQTAPTAMTWTIQPLTTNNTTDPIPTISNADCKAATFAPPPADWSAGTGTCNATLVIPPSAKNAKWRIVNTAVGGDFTTSNYVDINVAANVTSNFRALTNSVSAGGTIGKPLTLSVPYAYNTAAGDLTNLRYIWTANSANPSSPIPMIAGETNAIATVVPTIAGQYQYKVVITAEINGFTETTTGTVTAIISGNPYKEVIQLSDVQNVSVGDIVFLDAIVTNKQQDVQYQNDWQQTETKPATVFIANAKTDKASFQPIESGTYYFEYSLTKTALNGTENIERARTTVIVKDEYMAPIVTFAVYAGDAKSATAGIPVTLTGDIRPSEVDNTTYIYNWTVISAPETVTILNKDTNTASFIPSANGDYIFDLTVTAKTTNETYKASSRTQIKVIPKP